MADNNQKNKDKKRNISRITFIRYSSQKFGKPNNFIIFGSKKIKGSKQNHQVRLMSPMPEVRLMSPMPEVRLSPMPEVRLMSPMPKVRLSPMPEKHLRTNIPFRYAKISSLTRLTNFTLIRLSDSMNIISLENRISGSFINSRCKDWFTACYIYSNNVWSSVEDRHELYTTVQNDIYINCQQLHFIWCLPTTMSLLSFLYHIINTEILSSCTASHGYIRENIFILYIAIITAVGLVVYRGMYNSYVIW
jgi:hypothetical protein